MRSERIMVLTSLSCSSYFSASASLASFILSNVSILVSAAAVSADSFSIFFLIASMVLKKSLLVSQHRCLSFGISGETVIFLTPLKLHFVKSLANLLLSETSNTDSQNFAKTKANFLNEVKTSIFLQHFDISKLGYTPPLCKSFDHTSNICSISYLQY